MIAGKGVDVDVDVAVAVNVDVNVNVDLDVADGVVLNGVIFVCIKDGCDVCFRLCPLFLCDGTDGGARDDASDDRVYDIADEEVSRFILEVLIHGCNLYPCPYLCLVTTL